MDHAAQISEAERSKWEGLSRILWPHGMFLLCMTAVAGTLLDYMTTYELLENGDKPVIEGNPFSRALLHSGGWRYLFAKDLIVVGLYSTMAFAIYRIVELRGYIGRARLFSTTLLLVYLWARLIPAINNALLTLL